jgi:hypothetical protein
MSSIVSNGPSKLNTYFMKTIVAIPCCILLTILFSMMLGTQIHAQNSSTGDQLIAPYLLNPVNFSSCDSLCTFSWTSSGNKVSYELWISDNSGFGECKQFVTRDTTFTWLTGVPTNQYKYCKVRAWKSGKVYSAWSPVVAFVHGTLIQNNFNIYRTGGCNGDCSHCNHPCGRRPVPKD